MVTPQPFGNLLFARFDTQPAEIRDKLRFVEQPDSTLKSLIERRNRASVDNRLLGAVAVRGPAHTQLSDHRRTVILSKTRPESAAGPGRRHSFDLPSGRSTSLRIGRNRKTHARSN